MSSIGKKMWKLLEIFCPDKPYLSLLFKKRLGYKMNWKKPASFNQKLQWMKLYDRNPLYSTCADKVAVRDYVASKIGKEYLIPCLGVYSSAGEIDYASLPARFVLKCNHGAKYNIICKDKASLDIQQTNKTLDKWLKEKFWRKKREYHYKNIPPRIICEQYMEEEGSASLKDYKIFVFDGEPYIIQVDLDRFGEHKRNVYDTAWVLQDVEISFPKDPDKAIQRPDRLDEMLSCAKKLAEGFLEVRVDFYVVNGRLYFGEMTFFSGAGFSRYEPRAFEFEMGKKISLNKTKNKR